MSATALQSLRRAMSNAEIPALLVSDIGNLQWLSGFTGSSGQAIVTLHEARFLTDSRYTLQAKEEVKGFDVRIFASPTDSITFLAQNASELGLSALYAEAANTSYSTYIKWKDRLGSIELLPADDLFARLRMVKSAEEVDRIRHSCGIADACFSHVQRMIQPGVSEFDLSLEIEFFIRRSGAEIAFPPIVVSGERSARPHGVPSEKKLETGDFVTMDFGAKFGGYCSDITRTIVVGKASDRHREVYEAVLRAQVAAIDQAKPGMAARDLDAVARNLLAESDLAQYFGHGLGHGLGKAVHDPGRLASTSDDVLAEGQVWTIEPGVYIEGFGGVRIEDDIVLTNSGAELLTHSPKHLLELPA
jgi:Xaa-Pro aminopeptidase